MEIETTVPKHRGLRKLRYWLKYELSGSVLLLLSWFSVITIYLAFATSLVFTPFMLKVLFEEKRYGWIIFFFAIVILPCTVIFFFFFHSEYFYILRLVPLLFFYFYCFVLQLSIDDLLD